jgi:hypothetical protein
MSMKHNRQYTHTNMKGRQCNQQPTKVSKTIHATKSKMQIIKNQESDLQKKKKNPSKNIWTIIY